MIKWTLEDYKEALKEIDKLEHIAGAAFARWMASQDKEDWDLFVQVTDKLGKLIDEKTEQEVNSNLVLQYYGEQMWKSL